MLYCAVCFPSAGGREEGGSRTASSKEDAGEELKEFGRAAAERAGALSADTSAAVPTGHAHSTRLLPALSPLCKHACGYSATLKCVFD